MTSWPAGIVRKGIPELTHDDLRQAPLIDAIAPDKDDTILNWLALEGPRAITCDVKTWAPSITFPREFGGICHFCNEVLTRPELRAVMAVEPRRVAPVVWDSSAGVSAHLGGKTGPLVRLRCKQQVSFPSWNG